MDVTGKYAYTIGHEMEEEVLILKQMSVARYDGREEESHSLYGYSNLASLRLHNFLLRKSLLDQI